MKGIVLCCDREKQIFYKYLSTWRTIPFPGRGNNYMGFSNSSQKPLSHFQPELAQSIVGYRRFIFFFSFLQMNNSFLRKGIHPLRVSSFNQSACVIIAVVLMLQLVYSWEMFLRWVMWSMGLLNLCLSITHLYIRTYNTSQMKNDRLCAQSFIEKRTFSFRKLIKTFTLFYNKLLVMQSQRWFLKQWL